MTTNTILNVNTISASELLALVANTNETINASSVQILTGSVNEITNAFASDRIEGLDFKQVGEDIDGEAAFDLSGRSISISSNGSIVAIGAARNDGNGDEILDDYGNSFYENADPFYGMA